MGSDITGDRRSLPRLRSAPLGRDEDIAAVADLLTSAPLVTITGPGGMGKTTAALAVAHHVQDRYPDGVVFADLAPLPTGADVVRQIADAAHVEGADGQTAERLPDIFAHRRLLLVLDNCEHVLPRVAELVDRILERGDTVRILATSRELLGVAGEHVWPLGPLHDAGPALFVERARAVEPRVAWHPTDPAIVELCHRLDDVPLAIELAAGQLRRFDLNELQRRLDDRLVLLAGPAGAATGAAAPGIAAGVDDRHGTMTSAIDWSYRLLDRNEQALLRHLSVFPFEFDLEAAEVTSPPLVGAAPVAVFGQLVDKSLVVRRPGSGRYRLLETIRMFARERLEESGEATSSLERHRRLVRERVGSTSRLDRWMSARHAAGFCLDSHCVRQGFRNSLGGGSVDDAVEIALGGSWLWRNARGSAEGREWITALDGCDLAPRDRLWREILRADVYQGLGDHGRMVEATAAARELVPAVDDPAAACLVAHYTALGHITDSDRAHGDLAEALDLARASGDPRLVTLVEAFQAVADITGAHYDRARAALDRLDRVASEDGYDRLVTNWTGWLRGLAERDPEARQWMHRQQEYLDRTGIVETWISSLSTAMCDAVEGGDVPTTLAHTLELAEREGFDAEADCVLVLAYAAICADRYDEAAELVGTATHGRFNATVHYVHYRAVVEPHLRRHVPPDALAEALARGRTRTPAAALTTHGVPRP